MDKIIINTTNTDIIVKTVGRTVVALGSYTIPTKEYSLWSEEETILEIEPLITNGSIVVNNGVKNLSVPSALNWIRYQNNFTSAHEVYVDPNGSDLLGDGSFSNPFSSLTGVKNALDAGYFGTTGPTNPLTIRMRAGTYSQAPVDFSLYSDINIIGANLRTTVIASNPNANLITLGNACGIINLRLEGVSGASNWHLVINGTVPGSGGSTTGLSILNGSNGVQVNSTSFFIFTLFNTLVAQCSGTLIQGTNNVQLTVTNLNAVGNSSTTSAIEQVGSCQLLVFTARLTNMNKAIIVSGSTGRASLNNITAPGTNKALDQVGTSPIQIIGGAIDVDNSNITNVNVIDGFFYQESPEENQFRIVSELSVGIPNKGRDSSLGQGDSYTLGQLVYTFNGTNYVNVSSQAASISGSTFTYPNTSVNSAIYIGSAFDLVNPLRFYGIKANIITPAVLGVNSDIVFEYWNGTTWQEFNHMLTDDTSPYVSYANSKFEVSGVKQCMFDCRLEVDWVKNDPISLGVNLYWIRLRIDGTSLTTAPVFEQFKLQTSRLSVKSDGYQIMQGTGRIEEKFPISFGGLFGATGRTPNNQAIYLSDSLGIDTIQNTFPTNQNRSIVFNQFIPFELDTSCPLRLTFSYIGDSSVAGVVQWEVIWATSDELDGVYTSSSNAPTTALTERSISILDSIPTSGNEKDRVVSIKLDIPEAITQQTTGNPRSKIWVNLTRNVAGPDTYGGNAILTDFAIYYTSWREGGYSGEFI